MEREILLERLAQAEQRVSRGLEHIEYQRGIVDRLRESGLDTVGAEEMLRYLEESQALYVADRDQLRTEVGEQIECSG
jgi:hypothetical protein